MKLSIIIPVLDERTQIAACLDALREQPGIHEIIVVDGGSADNTVALARAAGARVVASERGRAVQQNTGAREASGDTLLFLHADVRLPGNAAAAIQAALSGPDVAFGAFTTHHRSEAEQSRAAAWVLRVADMRSRYSPLPYGDQALFLRADVFRRVGGFPSQPLMEDLELSRRLRRLGALARVPLSVSVSGRRFESAPVKQAILVNVFPVLYYVGVPPAWLSRMYGNPR